MTTTPKMLGHEPNAGEIAAKLRAKDPKLTYDESFTAAVPLYEKEYRAFHARVVDAARPMVAALNDARAVTPVLPPYDADAERARLVTKFRAEGQTLEGACVLASARVQAKLTKRALKLAKKLAKARFGGKQKRPKNAVDSAYRKGDPLLGAPAPELPSSAKGVPIKRPMSERFVPAGASGIDVLQMGGLDGLPSTRARDAEADDVFKLSKKYEAAGMSWEDACKKAHLKATEKKNEQIETAKLVAASDARLARGAR